MTDEDRQAIIEDEVFLVRDSGELPEIGFHSSLRYLTEEDDGPQITLTPKELHLLQDAALFRCREIVLRDIDPANRDLGLYRGVRRSIYNWQRMQDFCKRMGRDCFSFKETVAQALVDFLQQELIDVRSGVRTSSVNCSVQDLAGFSSRLELPEQTLPVGWQELCVE